jgi:asparagine synthase (glutamine-hydrolysing)
MCGIAGIVRFDRPAEASRDELLAMRARLAHRGPDANGDAFAGFAALAHTRLAMVDPAHGAQPVSDGRYVLVYNGELYDHDALRARLPGPWRTRCDTETVLAAIREWGEACVDHLDGMFAFFVWDTHTQTGFAARDRLGVKPFAYTTDGGFAFASEAKALLALVRPRADTEAIVELLVAPAFSGVARSPLSGIRYLQPGHVLRVSRDGVTTRRYWRWRASDDDVTADDIRDAFTSAVRGSLRADVPLGAFVSGGLDSTAIAAVARRELARLPAFTITFDGQAGWRDSVLCISDDTPFARAAARELDLEPHEVRFDRTTLQRELAELARVDDAIPAWEQELSQRVLARAASRHVKGVLVGDAADETHYGYHFLLDEQATATPAALLRRLGSVPVRREIDPDPVARLDREYRELAGDWRERVAATTQLIVERWLPRLLHNGDIHCMAFGLEARVPFASVRLVELAMRVGASRALAGGDKTVLRDALRGIVPEPMRTRKKSALPKDQGAAYADELARVLADPHPVVREIVDIGALARVPADERGRAQAFRVIALHHWAVAHRVAA